MADCFGDFLLFCPDGRLRLLQRVQIAESLGSALRGERGRVVRTLRAAATVEPSVSGAKTVLVESLQDQVPRSQRAAALCHRERGRVADLPFSARAILIRDWLLVIFRERLRG